jgi:hypothetical protein
MMHPGWFTKIRTLRPMPGFHCFSGALCVAFLFSVAVAAAQVQTPDAPIPPPATKMSVPAGYSVHNSVEAGGRIASTSGSDAMYSTLVNLQSGPRVLGQSFELRALPGTKHTLVDSLTAFSSGYGGDPNIFANIHFYKGKLYDFSGLFRRDRQYFDYNLLGNPNIPGGQSMPIGPASAPTGAFPWPQMLQSPVLYNTVRRMTDANLTLLPLSKYTFRVGYSQNVFEGPSRSYTGSIGTTSPLLLQRYVRESSDDFTGEIEWKPLPQTHIAFEEQITHLKGNTFFTLEPSSLILQEANGQRVAIGESTMLTPYPISNCNTNSLANANTFLYPAQTPGGLTIIDPACAVTVSYLRSLPTRLFYPTEILRLQSSSIPNLTMNGEATYTLSSTNLPNYYENFNGLTGTTRSITWTGPANGRRTVITVDFGVLWQITKAFTLAEQINYSNVQQPGISSISSGVTLVTPTTPGDETLNYSGPLLPGTPTKISGGPNGTPTPDFFGQRFIINNLTANWEATPLASFALTWRFTSHTIAQGYPRNTPLPVGETTNGTVSIDQNGGIFSTALRPLKNWSVNASVEGAYADNAFTPLGIRQLWHYKVRTTYKPRSWATISGAYNDIEHHNNTNNNQAAVEQFPEDFPYQGPIDHLDYSRVVSAGASLAPNEHYAIDLSYAYSNVYSATNVCYANGASPTQPGTANLNSAGAPAVCPGIFVRNSTTQLADWFARSFMHAPTNYGSAAFSVSPIKTFHANLGYRISAVNGSRFFNDARDVNGSLVSTYHSPFVYLAWTFHPGWTMKGAYDYYGYGEGGPSGPPNCSTSTAVDSVVAPCTSFPYVTGLTGPAYGQTAPRNFHSNNVTLSMHYEF